MQNIAHTTLKVLSVFLLLTFSNCAEAQKRGKKEQEENTYRVTGKMLGLIQQESVMLAELYDGKIIPFDTVEINMKDSVFEFTGKTEEPLMAYIILNPKTVIPFVLAPKSSQTFDISLAAQGIHFEVSGAKSEQSHKIRLFLENNSRYEYNMQAIENMFRTGQVTQEQAGMYENEYFRAQQESETLQAQMLSDTSNPIGAYFVFTSFLQTPAKQDFDRIFTAFEKSAPQSKYFKEVKNRYESVRATMVGEVAPDIKLPNPDGDSISLSSLRGKVVLIDFWASWCGPCRRENPHNKRIYERFASKGFEIYAVSLDRTRNDWVKTIASDDLPWLHVSDLAHWNCAPAKVYKVRSIPATFLIDAEGKILAKDLRGNELENFLENYFK